MKAKFLLIGLFVSGSVWLAMAGNPQRIGHVTLTPRHSNPDDGGLYNAFIDPTNGYAYFLGNYLFKLSITNNLPVQVCDATNIGSSSYADIDIAAGYAYITHTTVLNRYALGAGTNAVTSAGSITLNAGASVGAVVVDSSDADTNKHNAYVFCRAAGFPTRVAKVALSNFMELQYTSLNAGETNLGSTLVDVTRGYIYFATAMGTNAEIVKIKMTPGTNVAVRVGAVTVQTDGQGFGFGSLDPVHGYAYYGTFGSASFPSRIYKVKLGDGDTSPGVVGSIDLQEGQARLSLSVIDPVNGFVYFANDNTYPGGVHQFSLNGTNLPVEVSYIPFQSGPSNNPPNGSNLFNTTTNSDGILPYGEVFFRSAVFDPIRGNAYFGQDSKPCQVVMVHVAQIDPFTLTGARTQNGAFQLGFTNITGAIFNVLTATNLTLPLTNWTALGAITNNPAGQFQFTDPQAPNDPKRFYRVSVP